MQSFKKERRIKTKYIILSMIYYNIIISIISSLSSISGLYFFFIFGNSCYKKLEKYNNFHAGQYHCSHHHETWMIDFSLSIHYVQVYTIVGMARQNKSPSVEQLFDRCRSYGQICCDAKRLLSTSSPADVNGRYNTKMKKTQMLKIIRNLILLAGAM